MGFVRKLFVWILVFIIGSLILSFIFNPSLFDSFKRNVGNIIQEEPENSVEATKTMSNPSHQACLNEVNQKAELWKKKSSYKAFYEIVDSKHFDNPKDALDYFDMWSFYTHKIVHEEDISKENDITIVIVKLGNDQYSLSYPFVCVKGKLTSLSEYTFGYIVA